MKMLALALVLTSFASSSFALDKVELDQRIRRLTGRFESFQAHPDKRVPADYLRKAQGIILLDRTKAGFLFAFQGGSGVTLLKDAKTGKWSPAAFVSANEASLGFQVGGEHNFFVILLMHTNAVRILTDARIEFSGEARGTAGNATAGEEGKLSVTQYPIVVFDERAGFFGGVALKGGAISADDEANRVYYQSYVTMQDILMDKQVKATEPALELIKRLNEHSEDPPKRR